MTVRDLGSILFVGAHPDDEVFTAAGVMAQAVRNGQRVASVTATRGEKGVRDAHRWPSELIADIRARETRESLGVIGVSDHEWLEYTDGELHQVHEPHAHGRLKEAVERFRPDTILTFGPDGLTGHPDHQAVSRWAGAVADAMKVQVLWTVVETRQYEQLKPLDKQVNIFFQIEQPPVVHASDCAIDLVLDEELTRLKRRAFEAIPSQMQDILAAGAFDRPGEALARECFVLAGRRV